ncbi:hypothetical protein [Synechococcus sp. MU1643]|uniref:hypothetical protein n=1 Tax=Synechococcus sp. MU1643 TaxID=2508349 RepID=UPI00351D1260
MARIGSEAFAVFDGFEVVHLAASCVSLWIDAGPHGDLRIDAAVVAMGSDGLWNQQNRDAEQAEPAYQSPIRGRRGLGLSGEL